MIEKFVRPKPSELAEYFEERGEIGLLVVCGPSGVGKSTVMSLLIEKHPDLLTLYAYTDRPPRANEKKRCITSEEFDEMLNRGDFVLSFSLYSHRYGNSADSIREEVLTGRTIILSYPLEFIDGLKILREHLGGSARVVYLLPPSSGQLNERLQSRPERLGQAIEEISSLGTLEQRKKVDVFLVNSNIKDVVSELENILNDAAKSNFSV